MNWLLFSPEDRWRLSPSGSKVPFQVLQLAHLRTKAKSTYKHSRGVFYPSLWALFAPEFSLSAKIYSPKPPQSSPTGRNSCCCKIVGHTLGSEPKICLSDRCSARIALRLNNTSSIAHGSVYICFSKAGLHIAKILVWLRIKYSKSNIFSKICILFRVRTLTPQIIMYYIVIYEFHVMGVSIRFRCCQKN